MKKSKPRKRPVCSGVVSFAPQREEWSGSTLHVGGSVQGQMQLMVGAPPLLQPPEAEEFGPGTWSVPLSGLVLKNYLQFDTFIHR